MLLLGASVTFAQTTKNQTDAPYKDKSAVTFDNPAGSLKGSGEVFWECTFNWADPNEPRGWSLPAGWEIKDNSDNGNVWVWRKDTIKGNFTNVAPPSFFSYQDGFIAVPMDEYNSRDGLVTTVNADTYIQTPPINCSSKSSVVVKFKQYYRMCCSNYNLQMQVTNDGGVHWATYDVRYGVSGNLFTPAKYQNVEVNISDVAAGLPNVQIRIYMSGFKYYFWAVDDLRLAEAYGNDVVLEDYWVDFDNGFGSTDEHINYWPLSQMGMAGTESGTVGGYYFRAAFLNNGNNDAENNKLNLKVLKNGTEIENFLSAGNTVWSLERDTQRIENPWVANDYGDYQFNYTSVSDNGDEVPANNQASYRFTVNDSLGFRADFSAETSGNTGGWTNGGNAGDMVCVDYYVYKASEINSMTAYIAGFTAAETPQFQFVFLKWIDEAWEEYIMSDVMDMDSSYRNSWVNLPMVKDGESEYIQPGDYKACVRMWGVRADRPNGTQGMSVGRDLSTKFSGCSQYYAVGGTWTGLAGAPLWMVGFDLKESGGPTQAPVTFNCDLTNHIKNGEFHPGTDKVSVKGFAASWNATAELTDADGDGIYSVTVDGFKINTNIEYKYLVNDVEEAYPTTGNLHRNYVIRYWNVLNNRFNNGVTTGIPTESLTSSFSVYPNPTSGEFTVNIVNKVPATIQISLMSIQGQVIYTHQVANVTDYTETYDNKLSKGVYFLSVNNGSEVKVQKVIVK
jgi:hypothetical protein